MECAVYFPLIFLAELVVGARGPRGCPNGLETRAYLRNAASHAAAQLCRALGRACSLRQRSSLPALTAGLHERVGAKTSQTTRWSGAKALCCPYAWGIMAPDTDPLVEAVARSSDGVFVVDEEYRRSEERRVGKECRL